MSSYLALLSTRSAAQDQLAVQALALHGIDVAFVGAAAAPVPGALFVHPVAGPRWPLRAQALAAHAPLLQPYRYVWLPDDTLQFEPEALARLFAVCEHLGLDLAQPAFTPQSPCAQPIAWHHPAFQVRFTNYVDAAAPMFSQALLERVLPTLADPSTGADLGSVWPKLSHAGRVAIVDATLAERPAGTPDATSDTAADAAPFNLGGLLETGDALCLSARAVDIDAMLQALMQSAGAWALDASRYTRYLARHLDSTAATPLALEAALAGAGLSFNRVEQPRSALGATPARLTAQPADDERVAALAAQVQALTRELALARETGNAREHALQEADLRDLRARYAAVLAERDQHSALLAELAGQLTRAQYHCRELAPAVGAAR